MMKRKIGTVDGYIAADILSVLTLVALAFHKVPQKYAAVMVLLTALVVVYALAISKSVVKNRTNGTIAVKGENDTGAQILAPGENAEDIDGVKVYKKVYKIPDGIHATIKKDGKVKVVSIFGKMIYKLRGGLIEEAPDEGWTDLFDA